MAKNKIALYFLSVLSLALIFVFVYPGVYKYDKLNQKYPVKINRFTGKTQILYSDGWADVSEYNSIDTKLDQQKQEIEELITKQEDRIVSDVLSRVQNELNFTMPNTEDQNSTSDFDAVRNRSNGTPIISSPLPEEGRTYFVKGDSSEFVESIMGTPDSVHSIGAMESWGYDLSSISFKNGTVSGWSNLSDNLKLK
ncbi:hypothetical protein NYE70_23600 [Paenibacillus sp. FSL R5-0407]|uniref:hypothetical protein n=1 Tax=Paenibacillus sp. FSL R5-0407 TaxID=2975320 RepID=UPI0030F8CF55